MMSENGNSKARKNHHYVNEQQNVRKARKDLEKFTHNTDALAGYISEKGGDKQEQDYIEKLGKKIGRILGTIFVMYLLYEIVQIAMMKN